jgi:hypothetical protein
LEGAWIDDMGRGAFDEIHYVIKSSTEVKLVAVLLDIPNVWRADAVF